MMKIKTVTVFLLALGMAGISGVGCRSQKDKESVLPTKSMVGTWQFLTTYEKVDGKWVENRTGLPDAASAIFYADSTFIMTRTVGERADTLRFSSWAIVPETGEFRLEGHPVGFITQTDDDHYEMFSDYCSDAQTGEVKKGKFKDLYERSE